ncbi:hypothetical protein IT6_03070 [Methylacidiphilum caldifontis]|uniref:hypothetical protein n=1 Tax=Methylacidiphilum caldifontis TaxID=2795386 RepID=UPI001A8F1AAE|nr:hypothetical protein [Methylacidiphilum caldifontis]QSR89279.1 hypothetical protein IT6_03070 [Methylacidiphilum caldifontis]
MSELTFSKKPVIAYQHQLPVCTQVSWNDCILDVGYKAGCASATAPQNVRLWEHSFLDYHPRTELGKRLLALRQAYVASGGRLLSADEIDEELYLRRGRVRNA